MQKEISKLKKKITKNQKDINDSLFKEKLDIINKLNLNVENINGILKECVQNNANMDARLRSLEEQRDAPRPTHGEITNYRVYNEIFVNDENPVVQEPPVSQDIPVVPLTQDLPLQNEGTDNECAIDWGEIKTLFGHLKLLQHKHKQSHGRRAKLITTIEKQLHKFESRWVEPTVYTTDNGDTYVGESVFFDNDVNEEMTDCLNEICS